MNSPRQCAVRAAAANPLAALAMGALLCLPSIAGASDWSHYASVIGDVSSRARKAQEEIARRKREAEGAIEKGTSTINKPIQKIRSTADSIAAFKASIEATAQNLQGEGRAIRQALPGASGTEDANHASADPSRFSHSEAPDAPVALELSSYDEQWQRTVAQKLGYDLCGRVARRAKEKKDGYASRTRAAITVARGDVAELISNDPEIEVSVTGRAIQLGTFTPIATGSKTGWLNFKVAIENRTPSPSMYLFNPANGQPLGTFLATGPGAGDNQVTLSGVLTCSATVAKRLRASSRLEARITFSKSQFATGNQAATTACAGIANIALAPVDLQLMENRRVLTGAMTSFGGEQ